MKFSIYLIILFLYSSVAWAQEPAVEKTVALSWHTEQAAAQADAKEQGKPIFLFFTAGWCHFCHTMEDETLNTPAVSRYLSENFILFKVDYDTHKDLVARFRVQGVPALVIGDPELKITEQTAGFMPIDVFMAWAEQATGKVSPEAIAAVKEAALQFMVDISLSFRQGLTEDQYKAINAFYQKCADRDPQALEFARDYLTEEIKHNPGRFCRFLKDEKLHVRILTTNAFARLYGNEFDYDPWDLSSGNYARLDSFLKKNHISSLLEDLINF